MRLELASYQVNRLEFAERTQLRDGVLSINRAELAAILSEEDPIHRVDVVLTHPGDETRIVHLLDTIEPRC
ncbi:MAG TPA: glycine/sarcosine/betaine reductase component B subunit, partial [Anaerolineae bacterium]